MRTLNDFPLYGRIADISSAGQVYIPAADSGYVREVFVTLDAAITSADSVVTVKTARGTVGTLTIVQSGSAPGSTFRATFTENATAYVPIGSYVEVETDGGSSTTSVANVCVILRR